MNLISIDLFILLKARRFTRFVLKILGPILKFVSVITLGAGILIAYAMAHITFDVPVYVDEYSISTSRPMKEMLSIDTEFSTESLAASNLQKRINNLQNQARSLELSLKQMESKYKDFSEVAKISWQEQELADFASEAAGGTVLDTPDTDSYYESHHQQTTLFGIPLWTANYFTPRKVIQPWTQAGECWAFKGSRGKIVIELAYAAFIDQVALEHIPVSASLTGSISSAPKDFAIHASINGVFVNMDSFTYDISGPSSQKFKLENKKIKFYPVKIVLLDIKSNWGHRDYTCIYRFKVHGRIADSEHSSIAYIKEE